MATLRDYFDTDFSGFIKYSRSLVFANHEGVTVVELQASLHLDFDARAKFISFYIPDFEDTLTAAAAALDHIDTVLDLTKSVEVEAGFPGSSLTHSEELVFTGRVYIYSERELDSTTLEALRNMAVLRNLSLHVRGKEYINGRSKDEHPLAFIAHDSRDKDQVARPIAFGLARQLCPVWFDEYSLQVGARLRESIEKGLKECKKCVLIISPHFLANRGWTRVEFDSIFSRELMELEDFLLPVWVGVTKEQVYEYSPSLADRVAVKWDLGEEEVVRRLFRAIRFGEKVKESTTLDT